jgi:hypothetical protein
MERDGDAVEDPMKPGRLRTDGGGWLARLGVMVGHLLGARKSTVRQTYVAPFLRPHKLTSITSKRSSSEFRVPSATQEPQTSIHSNEGEWNNPASSIIYVHRGGGQQHYCTASFIVVV